MELVARGYTVWDEYTINVMIEWTNFRGNSVQDSVSYEVSDAQTAIFNHDCDGVTWFL